MGFVLRSATVIGLIYLASPLRPPLPEWLARPAALSGGAVSQDTTQSTVNPVSRTSASNTASSVPETISVAALKATMETATRAVATACANHEKSCVEIMARAAKTATDADPLAALIGTDQAHAAPASTLSAQQNQVTVASAAPIVPLPPRREPDSQKKI